MYSLLLPFSLSLLFLFLPLVCGFALKKLKRLYVCYFGYIIYTGGKERDERVRGKKEADQTKRVVPWYIHAFILYRFLFSSSSSFLTFLLSLSVIKIIIIKEKVSKKQTGLCWRMIGWSPGSTDRIKVPCTGPEFFFSLSSQRRFYIFVFSIKTVNGVRQQFSLFLSHISRLLHNNNNYYTYNNILWFPFHITFIYTQSTSMWILWIEVAVY